MIRYSLICDEGHRFESWFRSSADSDRQMELGLIECPSCGSVTVSKGLMAPSVSTKKGKDEPVKVATPSPEMAAAFEKLSEIREKIVANSDYVGDKFAEEARKIHYHEVEERQIYGEATKDDVTELVDEGIVVLPVPELPQDKN